jgi:hypothetical protein
VIQPISGRRLRGVGGDGEKINLNFHTATSDLAVKIDEIGWEIGSKNMVVDVCANRSA